MSTNLIGIRHSIVAGIWKLEKPIGTPGEQGEVWIAHSQGYSNLKFAIKIGRLPIQGSENPAYKRFVAEFDALASLSHPNIVKVYHRGIHTIGKRKYPFYVMEYLGVHVSPFDKALKMVPAGRKVSLCLRAFLDTATALEHVHAKKRVHGDIKGSNILVAESESTIARIKLIDFGFSLMLKKVREGLAGQGPMKDSSKRRAESAASRMHYDIWQLAHTIRRALDDISETSEPRREDRWNNWPIDYADYDLVYALLEDWSSIKLGSAPERKEAIYIFRRQIRNLRQKLDIDELTPDVKGAIRYFALPELATAAHIQPAFEAIRIPPRQLVLYTQRIKELITVPEMGTLRYTRQLGLTHLVYPGAQGTRFEHSLGVYGLACRFVTRMIGHAAFRKACTDQKDVLKLLIASLLHDVGHFPLAHQLEEFSSRDFDREEWCKVQNLIGEEHDSHRRHALSVFTNAGGIAKRLKELFDFDDSDTEDVRSIAFRKRRQLTSVRPAIGFLHSLLDGPIDLDKIDYVERDAHHCGVPYGHYLDVDRLLETMRVIEERDVSGPILAFDWRAVGSLEQLATARHQMYANVFWHRAVRSATTMFKHAFQLFQKLLSKKRLEELFFGAGSDDGLLAAMRTSKELGQANGKEADTIRELLEAASGRTRFLYKELIDRNHTRRRLERYGNDFQQQRATAQRILRVLRTRRFLSPEAERLGANNILIDCYADSSPDFDAIKIINSRGNVENLGDRFAPSVRRLKENFQNQACRIRVFINIKVLKEEFHDKGARAEVGKAVMDSLGDN
jgi:HD superfamily phosphohydrolase/serine/threonine protein kinase